MRQEEEASGRGLRGGWFGVVCACLAAAAVTMPSPGQLSDEDIEALRERGQREGWSFTVSKNPATQRPLHELCGVIEPPDWRRTGRFDLCAPRGPLPDSFDWRDLDGCTPIKHQDGCGSCWAFAAVGSFECSILIKDKKTVDLSEQWLVSCTSAGSCSGGWPGDASQYMTCGGWTDPCGHSGAVYEADFPYEAWDMPCGCPYEHPYCLETWAFIGPEWGIPSIGSIKQAILDYGPVAVCVYVNDAFSAYDGGIFDDCQDKDINHAVCLVGWDDSQGTDGVWILRNSWGTGWGEDGYMRIEYECSRVGYGGLYVNFPGTLPKLLFDYPDGLPDMIPPGEPTTFRVKINGADGGECVPDSVDLHYSLNGGAFVADAMTQIDPDEYEATFPAADCFDKYHWYVTAEEETQGTFIDPKTAPTTTYSTVVATGVTIIFEDAFETDAGWSVYAGADTGNWERADPQQVTSSGTITQPGDDHTPDGTKCYVTGPLAGSGAGSYDVDEGPTHLTSPLIDLDGTDAKVSYWRWYHISTEWDDELVVAVSNNDGATWKTVETIDDRETWTFVEWNVSDFVEPTDQVRVRFTADDSPNNSLVEALIDDFAVSRLECEEPGIPEDINGDGTVDVVDLLMLLAAWGPCEGCPEDVTGDGMVDVLDLLALLAAWGPCR